MPRGWRASQAGKPKLREWRYLDSRPTKREDALIDYQYTAACLLLEAVERAAGIEAVQMVNAALLARTPKHGGTSQADAPRPDWREWLDAVDELALVPAGVTDLRTAEKLLVGQGIATRKQLNGRHEARARYHDAMAAHAFPFMPLVVRDRMDAWDFGGAMKALALAEDAMALVEGSDRVRGTQQAPTIARQLSQASTIGQVRQIRDEVRG